MAARSNRLGKGLPSSVQAADYQLAFQRICNLFAAGRRRQCQLRVVGFLDPEQRADRSQHALYPGSAYVDWIAADGYDRPATYNNPQIAGAQAFVHQFTPWYDEFDGYGKPMMVSETGAPIAYPAVPAKAQPLPTEQANFSNRDPGLHGSGLS